MKRRVFLLNGVLGGLAAIGGLGCRSKQTAQVLAPDQKSMVGSHGAGSETFNPLVDESVARLLGRCGPKVHQASHGPESPAPQRICFVCVENKSMEDLGDWKEQIYQQIDTKISQSGAFQPVSRRFVEAGLNAVRLRPDQLFAPENMRQFTAAMEQAGQPFDYLLYATLTSGTTTSNADYQRDYLLTLEMVHVQSGAFEKDSATLRKGYNKSVMSKIKNLNPF